MERGHSHHRSRPQNIKYFLTFFFSQNCCSQGGKRQPRKLCIFSISPQPLSLSLSLSTLEIHINSTKIYGWTFFKHQSESDLDRNKMTLLLFANVFLQLFSCCLSEINWFFQYHTVGKISYCRHHHEFCRNHRTDMTWHDNIMYCLGSLPADVLWGSFVTHSLEMQTVL